MMKLSLNKLDLNPDKAGGLEIAVKGFRGDSSLEPVQVFIEFYNGKLAVHVWDGSSADAKTHIILESSQKRRMKNGVLRHSADLTGEGA